MDVRLRNNINIIGDGQAVMVFSHGFGCDQNMWRFLTPSFTREYKLVLYDLVGSGKSDLTAYDYEKYNHLQAYADDLVEVIDAVTDKPVIFVGHSVSAVIGLLASISAPEKFSHQIMVAPSPSYINEGDYRGGFSREDIEELCETIEGNYLGWSSAMAPNIMGAPDQPELSQELTNSFCRTAPHIAKHFANVTFTSDHRDDLHNCHIPSLILQCDDDFIAPVTVGEYMKNTMPDATLAIINNVGHCPHMSAPDQCATAITRFLENH